MKRSDLITVVSRLPITDEMKKLVAGSSVGEEELRAIRALCVEQFGSIVTRTIRDDFLDFYHKEIIKARDMGIQLAKSEIDESTG